MALHNYKIKSNKPAFSTVDDDEDISAFMNSSSAPYMAADRLPTQPKHNVASPEEERDNLLQQIMKVEQRTLDSSKRSLGALIESEKVGIETAQELSKQREQLSNAENKLDDINLTLKDTQKNINGIKSVFSSLKQWWTSPKQNDAEKDQKVDSAASKTAPTSPQEPVLSKNLKSAVEHSQDALEFSRDTHPALRLRGLDEEENEDTADFRENTNRVNARLDSDLAMMSSGLTRLKDLAQGLGTEIEDQNTMVDRIATKADRADLNISAQNRQMNRILKR